MSQKNHAYLHASYGIKSTYVPGGFDVTVAYERGFITDFQFKNTLKYPLYISAYVVGGKLTVEMWSTEDALEGKTYSLESIKLGYGSYRTLRHVNKDGKRIQTQELGYSYYFKE